MILKVPSECPNDGAPLLPVIKNGKIGVECSCGYKFLAPWRDKGGLIAKAINFKPQSSLGVQINLFTGAASGGKQIRLGGI
ncbi:MAG: hypothetical protein D4S01_06390 [Dehalococcoidia bacterium]|nr:MAG: hypothetical protein D4S01_06390 [Dehalococcoidia bacterium]